MKISKEVASSTHEAIANDALKDEDNGFWLMELPLSVQSVWLQRFYWLRWVDRLAEQDQLIQPGGQRFPAFYRAWQRLRTQGYLAPSDHCWRVLREIEVGWFKGSEGANSPEIQAWDDYIEAVVDYHQPTLTLATLHDYEVMLERLAGSCFKFLPYLQDHHREVAGKFGVIDQFYNNLRDLHEDARQGVCYFPTELLSHFGVTRQEVLDLSCLHNPRYAHLMQFWVESYLPELRQRNLNLVLAPDLHPTWQCLTTWFLHRYLRIERVMTTCQYNFATFAAQYWPIVQQDLKQQPLQEAQQSMQLQALGKPVELARLLKPRVPPWGHALAL